MAEGTKEQVALELMKMILPKSGMQPSEEELLTLYSVCLSVTGGQTYAIAKAIKTKKKKEAE